MIKKAVKMNTVILKVKQSEEESDELDKREGGSAKEELIDIFMLVEL